MIFMSFACAYLILIVYCIKLLFNDVRTFANVFLYEKNPDSFLVKLFHYTGSSLTEANPGVQEKRVIRSQPSP